MQFYGKANEAAQRIVDLFQTGDVPKALATVFIEHRDGSPCRRWSWSNQLLVALAGYDDARGYRQWGEVDRHVKKGEHGFAILCPVHKKISRTDEDTGERREAIVTVGFTSTVVFGYEQTEGEPLPDREASQKFLEELPLIEVAKSWGLKISTYSGQPGHFLGQYYRGGIAVGVRNLATWAHELVHAADDKCVAEGLKGGQHWDQEIVAELGGCIVLDCLGLERDSDKGGCWDYIQHYAKGANLQPISAIQQVLKRVCDAVALVMDAYNQIQNQEVHCESV